MPATVFNVNAIRQRIGEAMPAAGGLAGAETDGMRKAALLLHAMAPADRDWVLESLPSAQRAGVAPLLAELQALGIERDPALVEEAIRTASAGATSNVAVEVNGRPQELDDESFLRGLGPQQVLQLGAALQREPASLVAQVLRLRPWPWSEQVLHGMDDASCRRVRAQLMNEPDAEVPSAMGVALMRSLRAALMAPAQAVAAPTLKTGGWTRLYQRMVERLAMPAAPQRSRTL